MSRIKSPEGRPRRDPELLFDRAIRVLEFAWICELFDLSIDEYADCMLRLFPKHFRDRADVDRRIKEMNERTRLSRGDGTLD